MRRDCKPLIAEHVLVPYRSSLAQRVVLVEVELYLVAVLPLPRLKLQAA